MAEAGADSAGSAAGDERPPDLMRLVEIRSLAEEGQYRRAIREVDEVLDDRSRRGIWKDALRDKLRWLGDSGRVDEAIREIRRRKRSTGFRNMDTELDWWAVILYAGPGEDRGRAISRAWALARGPKSDRYVERAAYSLGILLKWDGRESRARDALEDYLRRYGDGRRYAKAAGNELEEL